MHVEGRNTKGAVVSGWLFVLGVAVMFVSSSVWTSIPGDYSVSAEGETIQTMGELVAGLGQAVGQLLFAVSVGGLLSFANGSIYGGLPKYAIFTSVVYFFYGWFFVDVFDVLFLNPFETSVPKSLGVSVSVIFSISRLVYGSRKQQ